MKKYLSILIILVSTFAISQNPHVESPKIAIKIQLGESVVFDDISLKFKEVLEDSRCPENVNCIWAGEIKIYVQVIGDDYVEGKEVTFGSLAKKNDPTKILYDTYNYQLIAEMVTPYPKDSDTSYKDDYVLLVSKVMKN